MALKTLRLSIVALTLVAAVPIVSFAQQEATIQGVITDTTGGVLPGATITVTHEASGNAITGATDGKGEYRIPTRTGMNRVTIELSGFATETRNLELLVGQQGVVNVQLPAAGVSETVTVTGATQLIDTTQSKIGGNIDPRQMQDLPVQGRNFLDLTLLAPGSRANATGDTPGVSFGQFQLNVDGQQITQNCCSGAGGQPKFSQDAIEEFQYVSQFDATQGRSAGVQVNVISKSGTNKGAGSFAGYFRDSRFIAKDFITGTVLPYSNQQFNGAYGGPIVKDKAHFFVSYEGEREPGSAVYQSTGASAVLNRNLTGTRIEKKGDTRLDFQLPGQTHLMFRGNNWHNKLPLDPAFNGGGGAGTAPSGATRTDRYSDQLNVSLLKVLSKRSVNELKVGYSGQHWESHSVLPDWVGGPNTFAGPRLPSSGTPLLSFTGYAIGTPANIPQRIGQEVSNARDDLTYSLQAYGRQDIKVGGEFQNYLVWHDWCNGLNGTFSFASGTRPPADIANYFPDPMNPATWNLVGLANEVPPTQYQAEIGSCGFNSPRHIGAAWAQDDWQIAQQLTLNLGLRWDGETGTFANDVAILPFLKANRPSPMVNWGPRLGGAYKLDDKTVIRAGWGIYYSETINQTAHNTRIDAQQLSINVQNTSMSPTFLINPFGGAGFPTFDQALASFCSTQNIVSNCTLRSFASTMVSPNQKIPHSFQTSAGVQRQFGDTMGAEATFVWTALRGDRVTPGAYSNANLLYDPTTGTPKPYSATVSPAGNATRPLPQWGVVRVDNPHGKSDYRALQTQFNKRFSHRWQAQATYTLAYSKDAQVQAIGCALGAQSCTGTDEVPFKLADDLGYQYGPAVGDQRHRATGSAIVDLGHGFQASGVYFYGSGQRFAVTCGADFRQIGAGGSTGNRYCSPSAAANASSRVQFEPGTTILVRNQLHGLPIHRLDVRLVKSFQFSSRFRFDGRVEVFNVLNHANYGTYTTVVTNPSYGLPAQTPTATAGTVYNPRTLQLGFRTTF